MLTKKGMRSLLCIFSFLAFCCVSRAQTTAMLAPEFRQVFVDSAGRPLSFGRIFTCTAGASCPGTPQQTFTDSTGATPNSNPIILDAAGMPTASGNASGIWFGSSAYKVVAQNSSGVQQWSLDNVTAPNLKAINSLTSITCTSPGPAASGFIRLCNGDSVSWRNAANTLDISLTQGGAAATGTGNLADVLRYGDSSHGAFQGQRFIDFSAAPAQSGVLATGNNVVAVASRNAAGSADVAAVTVNASNDVLIGKVTVKQPATGSTLTVDDGKTLRSSNTITLTAGADGTTQNFPATVPTGGALCYGAPKFQAFVSSGTFTIPASVTGLKATVVAGGGAGGGGTVTINGGGGGSGSAAIRYFSGLTPGNTIIVTIGAGGTGASALPGGNGSNSTLTSGTQTITTVTTVAGTGGASNTSGSAGGGAGLGGSGGDINFGGAGGNGGIPGTSIGGNGGGSLFGGGGQNAAGTNGAAGTAPGAGGGGGGNGSNTTGGNGAGGIAIFEWCQ